MKAWKTVLLVMVPLVIGLFMDKLIGIGLLRQFYHLPLALTFVVFWFWVGTRFAKLNIHWIYSFLLGNSLTFLLPGLYVWLYLTQASQFAIVSFWAQLYVLPVVSLSRHMSPILFPGSGTINTHYLMIFSYLLLILAFTVGFYKVASQKKMPQKKKSTKIKPKRPTKAQVAKPQTQKPPITKPQNQKAPNTKPQTKKTVK